MSIFNQILGPAHQSNPIQFTAPVMPNIQPTPRPAAPQGAAPGGPGAPGGGMMDSVMKMFGGGGAAPVSIAGSGAAPVGAVGAPAMLDPAMIAKMLPMFL